MSNLKWRLLYMNKKVKCCMLVMVFALLVVIFTSNSFASDDGADEFNQRIGSATVSVTDLNMRTGPGTEFRAICTLEKSSAVKILGEYGNWFAVYDYATNQIGFVDGKFISIVSSDSINEPKVPDEEAPSISEDIITPENADDDAVRLLNLTNNVRSEAGAGRVEYSEELSKVAYDKARDMVVNNYFSHKSPSYGTPFEMMTSYGIDFSAAAENIAGNQTVDGAFYAWMNSDSHSANIKNGDFTKMGIGVYTSPVYGKIIVQLFMR